MSIRVSSRVWDNFPGSGSELLAMLALADWCDDAGGNLFPSIAAVAGKMRCSESQARRVLHGLIADGWLAVVGNAAGGAPGSTRQYRINLGRLTNAAAATARIDASRMTGESDAKPSTTGCVDARGSAGATRKTRSVTGKRGQIDAARARTTSADARGRTGARPSMDARDGSHGCAETGSTGATQYCHLSVSEPSSSAHARDDEGLSLADLDRELTGLTRIPDALDRQVLARFVRHRRVGRRALSISAWLELLPRFAQLQAEGHDLNESLRQTMAAGLYLPVTPASSTTKGGNHDGQSLADRAAQQHTIQRRESRQFPNGGAGVGCGDHPGEPSGDVVDVEWRAVG